MAMTCALLMLLLAVGPVPQQPPAQKARIEGTVVREGTGDAVPRARVILVRRTSGATNSAAGGAAAPATPPPNANSPIGNGGVPVSPLTAIPPASSDQQGRFAIPDLAEGSYTLQVLANGFVDFNYGQRYTSGPGTEISLKAGQILKDLSITLTPAGNIGGRIRDREERPLANVPVQLLRFSYDAQAQRTYQTVGSARTDDHGDYRIYWMTPGRYYLMAGDPCDLNPSVMIPKPCIRADLNFKPVSMSVAYFPGVPDIASAQPIELKAGAELEGVNLTLLPKPPTYRIRGRVIDARNGQPPANAVVGALPNSNGILSNSELDQIATEFPLSSYNAATGEFEAKGLASGNYTLRAVVQAAPQLIGTVKVTIPNADVQGITISVTPPSTLSGRVRVDGTLPIPMERLRLQLNSRTPMPRPAPGLAGGPNGLFVNLSPDGTFSFQSVPSGEFRVLLQVISAQPGVRPGANPMYIKEARYDGADVLNGLLQIGTSVTSPLEIVVGVVGGQLSGTLIDGRNQPVPVSQVVLVPQRGRDRADLYRASATGDTGKFQFSGITPGDYKVFSWEGIEPNGWFDPELLKQSETKGTAVHITESSSDMIEVRLIPREGVQ